MSTFPTYILKPDDHVLDLFCAHFGGSNTLAKVEKHISHYTGIDNDSNKINELRDHYLDNMFEFVCDDAYSFIYNAKHNGFDVVISDQWTNQNDRVYSQLGKLMELAARYLVVSTNEEYHHRLPAELNSFHLECFWWRSDYLGGTYWAVYKRIKP